MKLLTKSTDIFYLHSLRALLETNGIPAFITGENTARMITLFIMSAPALWVYLDEQAEEAEALILDPEYVVQNPIDIDEFYETNKEITENPDIIFNSTMNILFIGVLVLVVVFIIFNVIGIV